MDRSELLARMREALGAIGNPRFYETERGFQGELLAQLSARLKIDAPVILEQEYQKTLEKHALSIRPDVILHEPFDPNRHADRTQGNLAVIELKLKATDKEAVDDFGSLKAMLDVLHYPLGIFLNVGSHRTFAGLVPPELKGRIVCFATALLDGKPHVVEEQG